MIFKSRAWGIILLEGSAMMLSRAKYAYKGDPVSAPDL